VEGGGRGNWLLTPFLWVKKLVKICDEDTEKTCPIPPTGNSPVLKKTKKKEGREEGSGREGIQRKLTKNPPRRNVA